MRNNIDDTLYDINLSLLDGLDRQIVRARRDIKAAKFQAAWFTPLGTLLFVIAFFGDSWSTYVTGLVFILVGLMYIYLWQKQYVETLGYALKTREHLIQELATIDARRSQEKPESE
jgi:putative exporter of polyketide antibiotics